MAENKTGRTYKATGITLKSMPMGESDRLLTILTKEHGLVRAITPGARKPKSSLRAISTGFVVGELFIVKGRNLDKLVQADCRASFPGLSRDLGKLTTAQYLAELALGQALSEHPQEELFEALILHLNHIAQRPPHQTLPSLVQGILHFLSIAGIAPQVNQCCVTQNPILPDLTDPSWRVGFDASAGGAISLQQGGANAFASSSPRPSTSASASGPSKTSGTSEVGQRGSTEAPPYPSDARIAKVAEPTNTPYTVNPTAAFPPRSEPIKRKPIPKPILKKKAVRQVQLDATELMVLQCLSPSKPVRSKQAPVRQIPVRQIPARQIPARQVPERSPTDQGFFIPELTDGTVDALTSPLAQDMAENTITTSVWLSLERTLRYYAQYHFDQPIRSAALIETCFLETMTS